jgi:hypothetical protein
MVAVGLLLFLCLYVIGSQLYPGGSDFNPTMDGYAIKLNYWCELMGKNGKNGEPNNARIPSILGMLFLCLSVSLFWIKLPHLLTSSAFFRSFIQISGVLSMALAFFIFQFWHDILVTLSIASGSIAFILSAYFFFKNQRTLLFAHNILVLLLIYLNAWIYMSQKGIDLLPMLQKMTFLSAFIWMLSCCLLARKSSRSSAFFAPSF